jgi:catechol 2,3-dioxygenase
MREDRPMNDPQEAPASVKIGHVRLKVTDLDRSVEFFSRFLHMTQVERAGNEYVFLSGGDPHHEIALMHVSGKSEAMRSSDAPGFDHVAFEVPCKKQFAQAYVALSAAGIALRPVDNGISWGMYFADPEGNQIELFCDTRRQPGGRMLWEGRTTELTRDVITAALDDG